MLPALLIALREGVEAALVVGIVLVYLNRTGRQALVRYVWSGLATALLASLGAAWALERWSVNQEGFEGVLLVLAAVFVVTMIVWMNRVARRLKQEIEQRVESYAVQEGFAAGFGLALFVFLMVLREGVELVIILRAVEVSSQGMGVWIGTFLGLAIAVAVGLFFFQGTLRIPLGRFFAATSVILMVVAFQLMLTGIHELSEARWIPSSKREMAVIGPIVRNDVFFFLVILGTAGLLVLREWLALRRSRAPGAEATPAERRRWEWELRKQRRWMFAAAVACVFVVVALTAEFLAARAAMKIPDATLVQAEGGRLRIPVSELGDASLHFYSVEAEGTVIRFLVIRKPDGSYGAALDACQICGPDNYYQDGPNVICRHCAAAIYIPSIGETGGCNPIGVASRVEGGSVVIEVTTLLAATTNQK